MTTTSKILVAWLPPPSNERMLAPDPCLGGKSELVLYMLVLGEPMKKYYQPQALFFEWLGGGEGVVDTTPTIESIGAAVASS